MTATRRARELAPFAISGFVIFQWCDEMGQQVSFELFKSARGIFLVFPFDCPVFDADTLVLSMQHRRLSAIKDGASMDLMLPNVTAEVAAVLASERNVAAVSMALGGITRSRALPMTVDR